MGKCIMWTSLLYNYILYSSLFEHKSICTKEIFVTNKCIETPKCQNVRPRKLFKLPNVLTDMEPLPNLMIFKIKSLEQVHLKYCDTSPNIYGSK